MKLQNKWFIGAMLGAAVCLVSTSCVDEIKFGNSFLDKAPGGNATIDTVFNSAEYTRQFLNTCYSRQYYGLPYNTDSNGNIPDSSSPYLGKKDALTDCWSLYFSDATVYQQYYLGSLNANYGTRGNIFPYTREMVWEVVRWCWLLMENIDRVPGMDNAEKTQLVAEAKCLIAARYFDMFRHYGGLPLLYASFTGTESGYEIPRATVEETVNYMIKMLDDAINSGGLVWAYADADLASKAGHWTKAGAMALKCKIWQFAASPLFNDVNGYAGGNSEAEQQRLVWYGGYRAELWDNCLKACEAFFKELESQGGYSLNKASEETPNSIVRHIVWGIFVRTARKSYILFARICRTLSTQVLICGILGLFRHFAVLNIRLHRNMWRCSHGPTALRLTGKRRKQKVSWMKCS